MPPNIVVAWDTFEQEWRKRGTDAIRRHLVELNLVSNSSFDSIGDALKREAIWLKAFARGGDTSLLAYFVFVWGMSMWELTSDHSEVRKNISGARNGYLSAYDKAVELAFATDPAAEAESLRQYLDDEQQLVHLILNSLTIPVDPARTGTAKKLPLEVSSGSLLLDAMNVESAVYSGSLTATKARANKIVDICGGEDLATELEKTDGPRAGIRSLLREVVGAHRTYYGCVAQAAHALQLASRHSPDAISTLDAAIQKLAAAQRDLAEDVYASELPAYRAALKAWRDRLSRNDPAVLLDSINITYVFPFALSGIDGKDAQAVALRYGGWAQISGLSASQPYELQLTDMWTWGGRRRELNSTISMPMPALTVELQDDHAAGREYDVALRFNDLGNHYLRVNVDLGNPTSTDINQSLRRATTYSGAQRVQSGGQSWDTVAGYARDAIVGVAGWISEMYEGDSDGNESEPQTKYEFNPDFDYHVVVALEGAHVLGPDGSQRDAKEDEILRDYGSLLLQMLNRETTTLDEWICWSEPKVIPNLLGEACFPGDFAVGTESTTVLYMPSTPRWARSGYHEVAEFAASFPPLIYQTRTVLDDKLDRADRYTQSDDDRDIDDQELALSRMRSGLHETLEDIRKIRTYLVPAQLLSLRAEGAFLDQLYRRSRLPELRDDIDGYLERGRTAIDRINTHEARLHDHRNRKYQDAVQWLLFFVGTFSLSGVAALGLTIYYGAEIPGENTEIKKGNHFNLGEALMVGGTYAVILVSCFSIYYIARRTQLGVRKRRPRG